MLKETRDFQTFIESIGFTPAPEIVPDGTWHHFRPAGRKRKSASYVFNEDDGRYFGTVFDHKTGERFIWKSERDFSAPDLKKIIYTTEPQDSEKRATKKQENLHATISEWKDSEPAPSNHWYLKEKGIRGHLARVRKGDLLLPIYSAPGQLLSLQKILKDGRGKLFSKGCPTKGGYCVLGDLNMPGPVFLAEGFATAATITEQTGQPCIMAYSAGNLPEVAKKHEHLSERLIIVADNDKSGAGARFATEAAKAIGCAWLLVPGVGNDANDFHLSGGDLRGLLLNPQNWIDLSGLEPRPASAEAHSADLDRDSKELSDQIIKWVSEGDTGLKICQLTAGSGKTRTIAGIIQELRERLKDGKKIGLSFTTKDLLKEFLEKVPGAVGHVSGTLFSSLSPDSFDELGLQMWRPQPGVLSIPNQDKIGLLEGRGKHNCAHYTKLEKLERPSLLCASGCEHYARGRGCTYTYGDQKRKALAAPVIAGAHAALFHLSPEKLPDVLICDEDITRYLISQTDYSLADLERIEAAILQRMEFSEPETLTELESCLEFIGHLITRFKRKKYSIIERIKSAGTGQLRPLNDGCLPDLICSEDTANLIEQVYERSGETIKETRALFSLLAKGSNPVFRVSEKGDDFALALTVQRKDLIEALKTRLVISLDATPINPILESLFTVERFERERPQNIRYYLGRRRYTKSGLCKAETLEKRNSDLLAVLRSDDFRQLEKVVIFTYQMDVDRVQKLLKDNGIHNAEVGYFGRDTVGTNRYKDHDGLIIACDYIRNLDATKDTARCLGIDYQDLSAAGKRADLDQAVARLRGLRRWAGTPLPVVLLSTGGKDTPHVLKHCYKPLPIEFLTDTAKGAETLMDNGFVSYFEKEQFQGQKKGKLDQNFERSDMPETLMDNGFVSTDHSIPFNISKGPDILISDFVAACLSDLGFYSHSLAGFTLPTEQVTEDMPAAYVSRVTYQKLIKPILDTHPRHVLITESGGPLRVWGSLEAARAYLAPEVTPDIAEMEQIHEIRESEPAAPALPAVYQGRDKAKPGVWSGSVIDAAARAADACVIAWARQAFSQKPIEVSTAARQMPENTEGLSARELLYSDDRLVLALAAKLITLYPELDSLPFTPPDLSRFLSPFQRPAGVDWG